MDWADVLAGNRVLVDLPIGDFDDLIAAGEVLAQEGLSAWVLPLDRISELEPLRAVFGRRVRLGLDDLRTPADVVLAADAPADFLLSPFARRALLAAAGQVPLVLGGLTPNEVGKGLAVGAAAVQVIPCDALGSLYARTITSLFPGAPLLASGQLERFQCELWLDAGALAVRPGAAFSTADLTQPDLAGLRHRCQGYRFG